jgi:type II secretory pathway component GspD/PulD (secretin)
MNSLNSSTGGRSLAANQGSNNILMNLRNLLALQASYRMEGADGVIHNPLGGDANPSGTGKTNLRGSIDYDAAHNQLSIVATRKQMEWVKRYLKSVDVPTARIGLDVLFVESDINPSESFGIDHSATLGKGFTVATPKDVSWGTTSLPSLPTGVALSSGALQATLNAWVSNKAAHITQRPAVVTRPDQDVCISTTKDIPIISNASVTSGLASTGGSSNVPGSSSGALQTGFSSDTQTIGTTLRLRAYPVNANRFSLVVRLEISSPDQSVSAGESLTGRIPTTVTTYEGEFEVSRGETLAIGGLERVEDDLSSGRVPVLGRIPFLGFAFKTKTRSLQKSHLTIFVTPNMIETALDGRGTAATSAEGSQQQLEMTRGLREKALRAEQKLERE